MLAYCRSLVASEGHYSLVGVYICLLTWKERVKAARGAARMHWLRTGAETARMASIVTILERDRGYQIVKGPG